MDCLPKLGKRKKKEAEQGTQWTTLVITGGCETIALVQSCPLPGQTNLLDNTQVQPYLQTQVGKKGNFRNFLESHLSLPQSR